MIGFQVVVSCWISPFLSVLNPSSSAGCHCLGFVFFRRVRFRYQRDRVRFIFSFRFSTHLVLKSNVRNSFGFILRGCFNVFSMFSASLFSIAILLVLHYEHVACVSLFSCDGDSLGFTLPKLVYFFFTFVRYEVRVCVCVITKGKGGSW